MRMSRRMGLHVRAGMSPESVTTSGGSLNYWSNASATSDKWHKTVPFKDEDAWFGRNGAGNYHNAAICFKTGSFTGRGKKITIKFYVQQTAWGNGIAYACQLAKHNWSTSSAWSAGSKSYYSNSITTLPTDPNAIAKATGTIAKESSNYMHTTTLYADILPNTEYVLYIIGTSDVKGQLVMLPDTASCAPSITVSES